MFMALMSFGGVISSPLSSNRVCRLVEVRGAPSTSPHFVVYSDKFVSGLIGPPPVSEIEGFNVFALSFLLTSGPADKAEEWTQLNVSQRSTVKAEYAAAGISLIVSAFGATDAPTSDGADPVDTANTMAAWIKEFDLDGIDVDYEDFDAMDASDGSAESWLASFTQQLRTQLPQGQFILTHAPVAPWFSKNELFSAGAYLKVEQTVGDLIDWYNVQFYNQGTSEYTTCDGLLNNSTGDWPNSALFQIAAAGVPLDKLVIGKPGISGDASNGFISPATLAGCVEQAKSRGWDAGVMVWEFPDAAASWIKTVRSQAFPDASVLIIITLAVDFERDVDIPPRDLLCHLLFKRDTHFRNDGSIIKLADFPRWKVHSSAEVYAVSRLVEVLSHHGHDRVTESPFMLPCDTMRLTANWTSWCRGGTIRVPCWPPRPRQADRLNKLLVDDMRVSVAITLSLFVLSREPSQTLRIRHPS
ncbi:Endochitinase 4 [Grifola frondosa]|uniref:Endochitinase 4 n=1 Tax=Grifola frondosa TaxID=5627 RepID=A0A1C7MAI6_GRIFR|nr:Endochitinase 4 [Grifola frondosa]